MTTKRTGIKENANIKLCVNKNWYNHIQWNRTKNHKGVNQLDRCHNFTKGVKERWHDDLTAKRFFSLCSKTYLFGDILASNQKFVHKLFLRRQAAKGGGAGGRWVGDRRLKRFVLDLCDFDGITRRQRRPKISVTRKH